MIRLFNLEELIWRENVANGLKKLALNLIETVRINAYISHKDRKGRTRTEE